MAKFGRVTIVDVASHAGVSRQTVSNALMHPERVKPPTLQHVRQVIDVLGYRPSSAAKSLRSQRAGAVGFELNAVGDANRNDVAYPFTIALGMAARAHDCHLVIFGSEGEKPMIDGYTDMVRGQLVDAFILADTHPQDPRPQWLDQARVPYAAFGRIWDDTAATSWADVDGSVGLQSATTHLLDAGYLRVGYLGWPAGSDVGDDRHAGWVQALVARGVRERPEATARQDLMAAHDAALDLVEEVGRYGAVACASDLLAFGVERVVRERGWVLGPDFGLAGFDDTALSAQLGITSVTQPLGEIAHHLLGLLHDRRTRASMPAAGRLFPPTLAARGSSSGPRAP